MSTQSYSYSFHVSYDVFHLFYNVLAAWIHFHLILRALYCWFFFAILNFFLPRSSTMSLSCMFLILCIYVGTFVYYSKMHYIYSF